MTQPYGLRRGLLWPQTFYLPAPTGGWAPDLNVWELDNTQAMVLDNWLIRKGKVVARGPFVNITNFSITQAALCGSVILDTPITSSSPSGVLLSQWRVPDLNRYIEPWNSPLVSAPSANLAVGTASPVRTLLDRGVNVQAASYAADTAIGPRWINFNGWMYGISYDAVAAAIHDANSNYFIKPLNLLTLPAVITPTQTSVILGAGAVTDDSSAGTIAWTSVASAQGAPDSVFATASNAGASPQQTHRLHAVTYGFAIPAGATITGIQVDITRKANINGAGQFVIDNEVKLMKAGVIQSWNEAQTAGINQWTTNSLDVTYGGQYDMWGTTWTPADINNANFGVSLQVAINRVGSTVTASVDSMQITVYYTVDVPPTPTVLANAPHGAFDLKGYLSRVWLLGGVDTPGALTVHEPTTLYYTNPLGTPGAGSPLGTNSADWKDPVTSITNKLNMDANNFDFGVGLAQVPNALLIFRHNSVWRLTGTTSQTFVLKPMSREVGCIDARSIAETDRGVFWISHRGLMFTDGTSIKNVSGPVQNDLIAAINATVQFMRSGGNSMYITTALTSQGQLLITVGQISLGMSTVWSGMYDPSTGAWNRLTSGLWSPASDGNLPFMLIGRPNRQQIYSIGDTSSNQHLVQIENPTYVDANRWGVSFLSQLAGQNGNFDIDKTDFSNPTLSLGNLIAIPYRWVTKLFPMGTDHRQGHVKRFFLDHTNAQTSQAQITGGWTLQPISSNPTNLGGRLLEPSPRQISLNTNINGRPVISGGPQRYAQPPFVTRYSVRADWEFSDMYFDLNTNVVANANNPTEYLGEIYGIGMEYLLTREYEGNEPNSSAPPGM